MGNGEQVPPLGCLGEAVTSLGMMKVAGLKDLRESPEIESSKVKAQGQRERELKIKDVACGLQHTVFITRSGEAFGCGKADSHQIQPYRYHFNKDVISLDQISTPELIFGNRRVAKAACGYKHTMLVTEDGKVYALGLNKFGQCGLDPIKHP
jgi:alpha-tubulin suppressor-like RCC1 family protein